MEVFEFGFLFIGNEYFHDWYNDPYFGKNQASSMITGIYLFISLCIGLFINLYLTMILSCMAFKFRGSYSFIIIKDTLSWVLSGALIPLDVFSDSLKSIFNYIPFQYITYIPVKIATNSTSIYFIFNGFLIMMLLMMIFNFIWNYMLKYNQGYNGNA
ncbi:ABC-2 family transporter protein [Photorhabdus bodei]